MVPHNCASVVNERTDDMVCRMSCHGLKGRLTATTNVVIAAKDGRTLPRLLELKQPTPNPRKHTISDRF